MRLIFIRHGDPDYQNDNLTEKGKREVALLTQRICKWQNIKDFYTSPMGRAKATGKPALEKLGRAATELSWLQEFNYRTKYPKNFFMKNLRNQETMCWDFLPEVYYDDKKYFDKDKWINSRMMKGGNIKKHFSDVCNGIDSLLEQYGYCRNKKGFYDVKNPKHESAKENFQLVSEKNLDEDCTLVFFCHLGVMFTIIAHLTGLSPMQLWQSFYVAPTSVTILNTEERIKGQAAFRVERMGDTNHLTNGGEPISSSGYFTDVFHE